MIDIFGLNEKLHEKVGFAVIDVKEFFLGSEVDVSGFIDGSLVAEVEVSHVVKGIKDFFVEHEGEHILFPSEAGVIDV